MHSSLLVCTARADGFETVIRGVVMQTVQDIMRLDVRTIGPAASLNQLENVLLDSNVGGLPVVEYGKLLGMVSRSDIVRHLRLERDLAFSDIGLSPGQSLTPDDELDVASVVSARAEHVKVRDVMNRKTDSVHPSQSVKEAAEKLVSGHIHRLPVVENGEVVGIVTSLDVVRLVANGDCTCE